MQEIPLPFGEWLPDLGENENPGLVEAKNVVARPGGYAPIFNPVGSASYPLSLAVGERILGSTAFNLDPLTRSIGFAVGYNGDPSGPIGALWFNGVASAPIAGVNTKWRFAEFNDALYAIREGTTYSASTVSNLYKATLRPTPSPGGFSVVSVSGLRGSTMARVGEFLMLGGCNDIIGSSTINYYQLRWSGFNQPESWAVSQTTQAGTAIIPTPNLGKITGIVGGRQPLIFQEMGVHRLTYVGPPKVWDIRPISSDRGCIFPSSIVTVGDLTYFFSHDGVSVTNGASVELLSSGRTSDYVQNIFRVTSDVKISAAVLWSERSVAWAFTDIDLDLGAVSDFGSQNILIYNFETNRFTVSDALTGGLVSSTITADSGALRNSGFAIDLFNAANYRAAPLTSVPSLATGDTLAAEVTTGYTSLAPGQRIAVNAVEPVYDGAGAKVAVNTKATQAGAVAAGTPVAVDARGIANLRADGRLAAVSVTFDAGAEWSELKGAVVTADTSGAR